MAKFSRGEVDAEFRRQWGLGSVGEDWDAWSQVFTEDVVYHDPFWGPLFGRAEVQPWINAVMKGVPEIYTVYDWHTVDDDVVVFHYQNRRDNPDPASGPEYFDFPGLSVLWYAGDGQWLAEEDYWDLTGARRTAAEYADACARAGITDPLDRMTRRHWGAGDEWTRTDAAPAPSWLAHDDLPAVTRPGQLYRMLGRERTTI